MAQNKKSEAKPEQVTIQFKVSLEEYADLQRARLNSENPRVPVLDFYRYLLLSSIKK